MKFGLARTKKFKKSFKKLHLKDNETFEKCSILFKFKEGENFKRWNTLGISRLKI
jgi:hypothetical protein